MILPALDYVAACGVTKGITIIPTWHEYLSGTTDATGHCNLQFVFPDDVGLILLAVIDILLRMAGIFAVGFVIYGGFNYMLSQGEPDKVSGAKQTITNALIGLVIALIATGIVNFVGNRFMTDRTESTPVSGYSVMYAVSVPGEGADVSLAEKKLA